MGGVRGGGGGGGGGGRREVNEVNSNLTAISFLLWFD